MRKKEHIARLFVLVAVLCFTLSIGTVSASEKPGADAGHTVGAEQEKATAAAHEAAKEAHEAPGHYPDSLSAEKLKDLFWRVINFVALMIILVKFGAKPLASGLSGRQKKIKDEIDELEVRKVEAEKSYREFESKLASVEKDIDRIVDKAVAQAEVEKAKIIEKAELAAGDIMRQAELAIQNEIMDARRSLKNDVAEQAAKMAEELIVKNLKPGDQVTIIEDYLNKVGAVQ